MKSRNFAVSKNLSKTSLAFFSFYFRECTAMEAKVKACRALLGKSTGIRIGVTLKAFKDDQHSKFENELDRRMQNEQVFTSSTARG